MKDHDTLRDMALYGITTSPGLSRRTGFLNAVPRFGQDQVMNNFPLWTTGEQIAQGASDLAKGNIERGAEGLLPRSVRGIPRTFRYIKEGIKDRSGNVIVPKSKIDAKKIAQSLFNITPEEVIDYYDKKALGISTGGGKRINLNGFKPRLSF